MSENSIVHQSSIKSYGVDLSGVCGKIWAQRAIYREWVFGSFVKHRQCEVDKMASALDVQSSTRPISMFLLAGQSNMAGRGEVPPDFEDDPRIRVIAVDGTWKIAKHPLHADKPEKAGVGPGISFAKSIVAGVSVRPIQGRAYLVRRRSRPQHKPTCSLGWFWGFLTRRNWSFAMCIRGKRNSALDCSWLQE